MIKDETKRILRNQARQEQHTYSNIKGSRWSILMSEQRLSDKRRDSLKRILEDHKNLATCYEMKEEVCELFKLTDPILARERLKAWFVAAKSSGIPQLVKFPGRNAAAVNAAMQAIKAEFRDGFSTVFKTITVDNGPEFEHLSVLENEGIGIYYVHPYCSSDRVQNENGNRLFRRYVPKGKPIEKYTEEEILSFSDELYEKPRKRLDYETLDDLFEAYLDSVYRMQ